MITIFELIKFLKKMNKETKNGDISFNFEGTVNKDEINIRIFKKDQES